MSAERMDEIQEQTEAIRRRELELLEPYIRDLAPARSLRILEIGAGTARASRFLLPLGAVTATDPFAAADPPEGVSFVRAPAEALPFDDGSFDLVFSTSVLEHLPDLPAALAEAKRVGAPDALHVHVVPMPTWKLLAMLGHFARLGRKGLARLAGRRVARQQRSDGGAWRVAAEPTRRSRWWPAVHGISRSNLEELWAFRSGAWRPVFEAAGFTLLREVPLLTYAPPETPIVRPTASLRAFDVASCRAFLLRSRAS